LKFLVALGRCSLRSGSLLVLENLQLRTQRFILGAQTIGGPPS
jgi:hypothetical protein